MIPATTPLLGFSGEISWPLGQISLAMTLGDEEHSMSTLINFMVVKSPSPYNGIIGHSGLRKIQADGSGSTLPPRVPTITKGIKVAIHPEYQEQTITIDKSLSEKGRIELYNMLKDNLDIFEFCLETPLADHERVPRSIAEHD
ncbi:hypothetical protein Tco_0848168 [Tanacetum coccineum]